MNEIADIMPTNRILMREWQTRILRHNNRSNVVQNPFAVRRMPASELISVAIKLGIDPRSVDRELNELDRWGGAFTGNIELDYTLSVGRKTITRRFCVQYFYIPEWEYYNEDTRKLHIGCPHFEWYAGVLVPLSQEISFIDSETGETFTAVPEWESVSTFDTTTFFGDAEDEIIAIVDKQCREEDARRRAEHLGEK